MAECPYKPDVASSKRLEPSKGMEPFVFDTKGPFALNMQRMHIDDLCAYIHLYTRISYMCVYMYVHTYMCIYVHTHIYIYVRMYINIYIYIYV